MEARMKGARSVLRAPFIRACLPSDGRRTYFSVVQGRRFIALGLLVLAACSGDRETRNGPVLAANRPGGQDPVVLRVARDGGTVRAFHYPDLDSLVWSSAEPASTPASVLAFDLENGLIALVDRNGYAAWIDLRLGTTTPAPRTRLSGAASADAWA